jgi:hypothetical protein
VVVVVDVDVVETMILLADNFGQPTSLFVVVSGSEYETRGVKEFMRKSLLLLSGGAVVVLGCLSR